MSFTIAIALIAVLAGAIASVAGFGIGSVLVGARLQLNPVELILGNHSGDQSSSTAEPVSALTRWGLKPAQAQLKREPL